MNGCTPGKHWRGWTGARGDRPESGSGLAWACPGRRVTGRTWCAAPCKPLFLRHRAPRLPGPWHRQRAGRGASLPTNPYSFVTEHHVFRGQGAGNRPDVVRRSPQTLIPSSPSTTSSGAKGAGGGSDVVRRSLQTLIPSSPSTTSSGAKAPATGRTWCAAPRKPLFLRRQVPRLPRLRRRCWRDPTEVKGFARSQAPTWPAPRREIPFFHF